MKREFSPDTIGIVLGTEDYRRSPLHVDFTPQPGFVPSTPIEGRSLTAKTKFNAIGSRVLNKKGLHLPVIDVDAGVTQRINYKGMAKTVIYAARVKPFKPDNDIEEIFGDHGIDAKVHTIQDAKHSHFKRETDILRPRVCAITLTAKPGTIETVQSTYPDNNHVYLQEPFSDDDHEILLSQLHEAGIVTNGWRALAQRENMGVLRTPWTEKARDHSNS